MKEATANAIDELYESVEMPEWYWPVAAILSGMTTVLGWLFFAAIGAWAGGAMSMGYFIGAAVALSDIRRTIRSKR